MSTFGLASTTEHRNVAVLVGNGLSIAFNNKLLLSNITAQVRKRINQSADGNQNVVLAMRELADTWLPPGENSDDDFERLIGAFGAESKTLTHLHALAKLSYPDDEKLMSAIQIASDFAQELRDVGTSHVLEVVYQNSASNFTDGEPLNELVRAIYKAFTGRVSFGNLNYDTILLAALMSSSTRRFADMGNGLHGVELGKAEIPALKLRETAADFPNPRMYPVQLLHLHGSLTYWKTVDDTDHGKISRGDVASYRLFKKMRKGTTDLRPLVVLNRERQKIEDIQGHPFKLAYEMFNGGLERSDHWLIIGYSFRDVAVNDLLRREFIRREKKPKVLVVGHGEEPSRSVIESAMGWGAEDGPSTGWLRRNLRGAYGLHEQPSWKWFTRAKKRPS